MIHGVTVGMVILMIYLLVVFLCYWWIIVWNYGSDTLCLPTGCYDITVGGGSYPSEVSFDFGSLVGSGVGTYTNISIGGSNLQSLVVQIQQPLTMTLLLLMMDHVLILV